MNKKHVLKLGGSLLFNASYEVNMERVAAFVEFIKQDAARIDSVVVGGGKVARLYIEILRGGTLSAALQDTIGIDVSRLNARTMAFLAGPDVAWSIVPCSVEELLAMKAVKPAKIAFLGGLAVGQSTTTVACQVAAATEAAGVIIGTDVDGVYTKDPKVHPDARKLDTVTLDELASILGTVKNQAPGEYRIFDEVSASVIRAAKVPVRIVKGDIDTIDAALQGEPVGTLIVP